MEQTVEKSCQITQDEAGAVVRFALKMGEVLLINGGEVSRVEDTVTRLCRAYGAARVDVFAITSVIFVTAIWKGGIVITQSRRIKGIEKNTMRIEAVNALSRRVCSTQIPPDEARLELEKIIQKGNISKRRFFLASLVATASYAAFFGGDWKDAAVALVVTVLIVLSQFASSYLGGNRILANVLCCFFASTAATLICAEIGTSLDMVMAGCIMVLIPGIAMTSAVENLLIGDTLSGLLGLMEALITALALAGGFALSQVVVGAMLPVAQSANISNPELLMAVQIATSFTGSLGFSLLFGLHGKQLPIAAIGAALTWVIYLMVEGLGGGFFLANVLAATFAGIYTEILVRYLKVPKTVLTFSVLVSLIPGRALYNTMNFAIKSEFGSFVTSGVTTISVAAAIAIGLTIVLVGAQVWHKLYDMKKTLKQ